MLEPVPRDRPPSLPHFLSRALVVEACRGGLLSSLRVGPRGTPIVKFVWEFGSKSSPG
jgi:hypothetical protein